MSAELASYEGLVFRTAQMYAPMVQEDVDDIRQLLRIKVWQALSAYDPAKATQTREKYVFMCVKNRVKDLLKKKKRPECFIEDEAPADRPISRERWELENLSAAPDQVYGAVEDEGLPLPSTLTVFERRVLVLLVMDSYTQTEVAKILGVTRAKVRAAHAEVAVKMADWAPDGEEAPAVLAVAA